MKFKIGQIIHEKGFEYNKYKILRIEDNVYCLQPTTPSTKFLHSFIASIKLIDEQCSLTLKEKLKQL
jgi:hypothetical protein